TITKIWQDEPTLDRHFDGDGYRDNDHSRGDDGFGPGNTPIDGVGIGTSTAQERAELSMRSDGRVYQIFFTASDGRGGTCDGSVTVGAPIDLSQPAVDSGVRYDSTV